MDLILLVTAFSGLVIVLLFYFVFKYQKSQSVVSNEAGNVNVQQQATPRRAVGARNRMRGSVAARPGVVNDNNQHVSEDDTNTKPGIDVIDPKIGAKKRAKLEAKAEKKAQREAELKMREQRKKQQEKDEYERKLQDEKEKLEEEKFEEEKRKLEEEKQRKEEEEYQKMKEEFSVEEDGFDEEDEEKQGNLLQEFVDYIKETKVVMLEDIAAKFNLKIQTVISRIEDLLASGILTGVIDDRGKFIYITMEELQAVADFVKKRGRVTIQELVENSNNLITLS